MRQRAVRRRGAHAAVRVRGLVRACGAQYAASGAARVCRGAWRQPARAGRRFPRRRPGAPSDSCASRPRSRAPAAASRDSSAERCGTTGSALPWPHEDRHARVRRAALGGGRGGERQVGRQRDDAGQRSRMAQAAGQRDRAALREAGEHDALGRNAALVLARDQRFDLRRSTRGCRPRPAARAIATPRMSYHARIGMPPLIVTGAHRRMRKHEAQRRPVAVDQLRHDRREVVAVGAEAVQPDHRCGAGSGAVSCSTVGRLMGDVPAGRRLSSVSPRRRDRPPAERIMAMLAGVVSPPPFLPTPPGRRRRIAGAAGAGRGQHPVPRRPQTSWRLRRATGLAILGALRPRSCCYTAS